VRELKSLVVYDIFACVGYVRLISTDGLLQQLGVCMHASPAWRLATLVLPKRGDVARLEPLVEMHPHKQGIALAKGIPSPAPSFILSAKASSMISGHIKRWTLRVYSRCRPDCEHSGHN
jgi:hypothetical protein